MVDYTTIRALTSPMKGGAEAYIEKMLQKLVHFIPFQYDPLHPLSLTFEVNDNLSIMEEMDPNFYLKGSSFQVEFDLNGVLTLSEFKNMNKLFFTSLKEYLYKNGFTSNENVTAFSKNIL